MALLYFETMSKKKREDRTFAQYFDVLWDVRLCDIFETTVHLLFTSAWLFSFKHVTHHT